jgi:hypothetical protein
VYQLDNSAVYRAVLVETTHYEQFDNQGGFCWVLSPVAALAPASSPCCCCARRRGTSLELRLSPSSEARPGSSCFLGSSPTPCPAHRKLPAARRHESVDAHRQGLAVPVIPGDLPLDVSNRVRFLVDNRVPIAATS